MPSAAAWPGAVEARWGRIDGLVNNAGTTRFHDPFDLEGLTADDFASSYAVNVTGAFQMARAAVPAMKRAGGGAIVNVSSFARRESAPEARSPIPRRRAR